MNWILIANTTTSRVDYQTLGAIIIGLSIAIAGIVRIIRGLPSKEEKIANEE